MRGVSNEISEVTQKPSIAPIRVYAGLGAGETPEERAGQIEQDIPKPINLDLKRPFPNKRKRTNPNESQLTGQPGGLFQEHNNPKVMQNI